MAHDRDHFPERTSDARAVETEPLLTQAAACTKRGETGQAEKLIRQLLAREPQHAGALFEPGRISYRAGDKKAAADCLRKAIASQPDNGQFYNELAFVLIGLGDNQEAARAFARALEINPDDADTIGNMGAFHLKEGRIIEAVAAFSRSTIALCFDGAISPRCGMVHRCIPFGEFRIPDRGERWSRRW
jgi:Flp pilus assembly protein TadD